MRLDTKVGIGVNLADDLNLQEWRRDSAGEAKGCMVGRAYWSARDEVVQKDALPALNAS